MTHTWIGIVILSTLAAVAVTALFWKKIKHSYLKVGKIKKLYFYPVKSLRGIEVTEGRITKLGFEFKKLLDRSFMLIDENNTLLSQRQTPTLSLLSTKIIENKLFITGPNTDSLTIIIESTPNPDSRIFECKLHCDVVFVVDAGDRASEWFQNYLERPNIRLVRFYPEFPNRKYVQNNPFFRKLRAKTPISLQDMAPIHLCSQPSIDDLNQRIEGSKVSVLNFRPNILVEGCDSYAEDTWEFMKFGNNESEIKNVLPVTRCLLTTVDPDTGILTQKEPLNCLRKYRIPKDPEMLKKTGSIPCFGTGCTVIQSGNIKLYDDVFATVSLTFETVKK